MGEYITHHECDRRSANIIESVQSLCEKMDELGGKLTPLVEPLYAMFVGNGKPSTLERIRQEIASTNVRVTVLEEAMLAEKRARQCIGTLTTKAVADIIKTVVLAVIFAIVGWVWASTYNGEYTEVGTTIHVQEHSVGDKDSSSR